MPTEQPPTVSRRKLGIFGVVALIGAGLIVATGIRAREDQGSKLREWTDNQAVPTVAVALPNARALNPTLELPGRLEAYYRAPIFARVSRLSEKLERRYRRQGQGGPGDRRDRGARTSTSNCCRPAPISPARRPAPDCRKRR